MKTHMQIFHEKTALLHNEMAGIIAFHKQHSQPPPDLSPTIKLLDTMYREEFELASLLDTSDIVLHAEGTSTISINPRLDILTWLLEKANQQLENLIKNTFSIANNSYKNNVNFELTGLAHGSIYAGFRAVDSSLNGFQDFGMDSILNDVRNSIEAVVDVPQFLSETGVSDGIITAIPDAGMRDIAMMTALNLSPSGRNGVHTIDISAPMRSKMTAELSTKTRVILRETAAKKPVMSKNTKHGNFIGDLREIDLDKHRITIRNVSTDGFAIRCVFAPSHEKEARAAIASQAKVKITGHYEEDKNGKPRLMTIESLEPVPLLV